MRFLVKHWARIAISLIPLILALGHASGLMRLHVVESLDNMIYDTRLRWTMPKTLDSRIVIVDVDEKSLAEMGRWPWGRDNMAALTSELLDRQKVSLIGFDFVFAEPDHSSGLASLKKLADQELSNNAAFKAQLSQLESTLDFDAQFAASLRDRPVVLGYYFTSDGGGRASGQLPSPVLKINDLGGHRFNATAWDGYGANIARLAKAAPQAGFFNAVADVDGVVRATPLLAQFQGQYYESLSLAMFRQFKGFTEVSPTLPKHVYKHSDSESLESVLLTNKHQSQTLAVDDRAAVLIPYRGDGGAKGGSFEYVSAADVLAKRLNPAQLSGKIVLIGSTAPGLLDLRVTPVGQTYPGVEAHANLLSGMLDGVSVYKPDFAMGYEIGMLWLTGLMLILALPLLTAFRALVLNLMMLAAMLGLNYYFFTVHGMVLPLASLLLLGVFIFILNMSYGYLVESRAKRELTQLFGSYVPPQLVEEMVAKPHEHTMKAASKNMTVMFCDMRGFTQLAELMEPTQLQDMLNGVFGHLTELILHRRGTIDKYMGDCVMAFWGAPVATEKHAELAVQAALDITHAVIEINKTHQTKGFPEIQLGIGINTGVMCVGDMGSFMRRSFTVVGDAVNLASRLEELTKIYAVEILVSESTRQQAPSFDWQEVDKVRVNGKKQVLAIYTPVVDMVTASPFDPQSKNELVLWQQALQAYRAQDWDKSIGYLQELIGINPQKPLYDFYIRRIGLLRLHQVNLAWDGTSDFDAP